MNCPRCGSTNTITALKMCNACLHWWRLFLTGLGTAAIGRPERREPTTGGLFQ